MLRFGVGRLAADQETLDKANQAGSLGAVKDAFQRLLGLNVVVNVDNSGTAEVAATWQDGGAVERASARTGVP